MMKTAVAVKRVTFAVLSVVISIKGCSIMRVLVLTISIWVVRMALTEKLD